jgi:hypothetical protein
VRDFGMECSIDCRARQLRIAKLLSLVIGPFMPELSAIHQCYYLPYVDFRWKMLEYVSRDAG